MATIIRIKRSANATAPSTLKLGEMAYAYGTGTASNGGDRLYIGTGGTDGSLGVPDPEDPGGSNTWCSALNILRSFVCL